MQSSSFAQAGSGRHGRASRRGKGTSGRQDERHVRTGGNGRRTPRAGRQPGTAGGQQGLRGGQVAARWYRRARGLGRSGLCMHCCRAGSGECAQGSALRGSRSGECADVAVGLVHVGGAVQPGAAEDGVVVARRAAERDAAAARRSPGAHGGGGVGGGEAAGSRGAGGRAHSARRKAAHLSCVPSCLCAAVRLRRRVGWRTAVGQSRAQLLKVARRRAQGASGLSHWTSGFSARARQVQ